MPVTWSRSTTTEDSRLTFVKERRSVLIADEQHADVESQWVP
jgi:hypothetical protein